MATTYSATSEESLDIARQMLTDTGTGGEWLLTDEEINRFLNRLPFNAAVAYLAEQLAVRFAQYPDETESANGQQIRWTERVSGWRELAKSLRANDSLSPVGARPKAVIGLITEPSNSRLR